MLGLRPRPAKTKTFVIEDTVMVAEDSNAHRCGHHLHAEGYVSTPRKRKRGVDEAVAAHPKQQPSALPDLDRVVPYSPQCKDLLACPDGGRCGRDDFYSPKLEYEKAEKAMEETGDQANLQYQPHHVYQLADDTFSGRTYRDKWNRRWRCVGVCAKHYGRPFEGLRHATYVPYVSCGSMHLLEITCPLCEITRLCTRNDSMWRHLLSDDCKHERRFSDPAAHRAQHFRALKARYTRSSDFKINVQLDEAYLPPSKPAPKKRKTKRW